MYTVEPGRECTAYNRRLSSPIRNWYDNWNPEVIYLASTQQAYGGTSGDQYHYNWWLKILESNMWERSIQNT